MKILITAFEPFGGDNTNSSAETLKLIKEKIGDKNIVKALLPVEFGTAAKIAEDTAVKENANAIICLGQAAGRNAVTPEMIAINLRYASIPDNKGERPLDTKVTENGPDAIFSNLPIRKMAERINACGIRSAVSYSAGTYVCNDLYYNLLYRFKSENTGIAFIHVPKISEDFPVSKIALAIEEAVKVI